MGGDLPAAAKAIEENVEEKERLELDRKGMEDAVTKNENRQSAGSSSESASDLGPELFVI